MSDFLITFFPRGTDSEFRVSDISNIVVDADSEKEAIKKFVKKAKTEYDIRNFIISFLLACGNGIGTPFKNQEKLEKTFKKLNKMFDEAKVCDMDLEDEEYYSFINENASDFIFLIDAYVNAGCDIIKINDFQRNKSMYI